jgi:S-adenosylmethionine decarboxylase
MPHPPDGVPEPLLPGTEWLVDAYGCDALRLRSPATLSFVFDRIVADLGLNPLRDAVWHTFPGAAGITGLLLLSESHLACHTFPEHGFAAFNLYCCRSRREWPWQERLAALIGAEHVLVRSLVRGHVGAHD